MRIFALAGDKGKSYSDSLRLMLKAILVSPQFLFITPDDANGAADSSLAGSIVELDDYQLASHSPIFFGARCPMRSFSNVPPMGH